LYKHYTENLSKTIGKVRLFFALLLFLSGLIIIGIFGFKIYLKYGLFNVCSVKKYNFIRLKCDKKYELKQINLIYKDFQIVFNDIVSKKGEVILKNSENNNFFYKDKKFSINFNKDVVIFYITPRGLKIKEDVDIAIEKIGNLKIKNLLFNPSYLKINFLADNFEDFLSFLFKKKILSDFGILDIKIDAVPLSNDKLKVNEFIISNSKFKIDGSSGLKSTKNSTNSFNYNFDIHGVFDLVDSVFNFLHINRETLKIYPTSSEYAKLNQVLTILKSRESIKTEAGRIFLNIKKQEHEITLNGFELNELMNDENEFF
jgi:hypothetical protein